MCRVLTLLILGVREDVIQLEEGRPNGDVDSLARTDVSHGTGWAIPGHPEYVHLQYGHVIGRQHGSWEV